MAALARLLAGLFLASSSCGQGKKRDWIFFLRMLHRTGHAEIERHRRSRIHPERVSETSTQEIPNRISLNRLFLTA